MEIIKTTIKVGNSAGVLLPKQWLNSQVKVILKPLNIEKEIVEILMKKKWLKEIQGVYIIGSYARGEQTIDSDIDVLVITKGVNKRIKSGKYEVILVSKTSVEKQLMNNVLPLLPMLKEAKSVINSQLIEPYKETKLTKKNLGYYIETTKSAMGVVEKSIRLSKEMNMKEGDGSAYSLVLRLRGVYIIECLKKGKNWSKKEFLGLIKKIAGSLKAYEGYLRVKAGKKMEDKLLIKEAEQLYVYIFKKIKEQENWLKNET